MGTQLLSGFICLPQPRLPPATTQEGGPGPTFHSPLCPWLGAGGTFPIPGWCDPWYWSPRPWLSPASQLPVRYPGDHLEARWVAASGLPWVPPTYLA